MRILLSAVLLVIVLLPVVFLILEEGRPVPNGADLRRLAAEVKSAAELGTDQAAQARSTLIDLAARVEEIAKDGISSDERSDLVEVLERLQRTIEPVAAKPKETGHERFAAARVARSDTARILREMKDAHPSVREYARSFLVWLTDLIKPFLPWPLVIAVTALLLFSQFTRENLHSFLARLQTLKLGGFELILNKEHAAMISKRLELGIAGMRRQAKQEFDNRVVKYGIRESVRLLVEDHIKGQQGGNLPDGFKCTLYIPDALFAETLYQLTDYWPTGGGSGRTWSIRFGMIGRAWRSNKPDQNSVNDRDELIQRHGMTSEEAERLGGRDGSFGCTVLHDEVGGRVALLYISSDDPNAIGAISPAYHDGVDAKARDIGLTTKVKKISEEVRERLPFVRIHTQVGA